MKKSLLFGILFVSILACAGQNKSDTIEIRKKAYLMNGKYLNLKQISNIVKPNEQAYKYMSQARTSSFFAGLLSSTGGALIGWPIGTALGGGEPMWEMAGIGAGLVAVAFAIAIPADKKVGKAVRMYNSGLQSSISRKNEWKFGLADHGIGVKITF